MCVWYMAVVLTFTICISVSTSRARMRLGHLGLLSTSAGPDIYMVHSECLVIVGDPHNGQGCGTSLSGSTHEDEGRVYIGALPVRRSSQGGGSSMELI